MRVVALSGSTSLNSLNTKLLTLVIPKLTARAVTVDAFDFRAAKVPMFDPDVHPNEPPKSVLDFKERLRAAQGLLIVSPEYNYSIPGALKNLIDIASRPPKDSPFKGKVAAQMGVTTGKGGTLQLQVMLRHVLVGLQCISVPGAFTLSNGAQQFDDQGAFVDEANNALLGDFLGRFVDELKVRAR